MRLTIGVAIPCYKGHLCHLKRVLDSIEAQIRKPEIVVISSSSSRKEDLPSIQRYSFHLKIITHSKRRNAAMNRNYAGSKLKTDLISFFDADDIMHPQRLEIMERAFLENPQIKIFLHDNTSDEFQNYPNPIYEIGFLRKGDWGGPEHLQRGTEGITNGHLSIRREVFQRFQFPESSKFHGKEDTIFSATVISAYPNRNGYTPLKLSRYLPSATRGYLEK